MRSIERKQILLLLYPLEDKRYTSHRTVMRSIGGIMMDLTAVAKRISTERKARHMTQEDLAAKAEVSPTHIGVIERGAKIPNLDTFVAIANALDVSADKLLQDVVNRSGESTATELSLMLAEQPLEMQRKIYNAVRALVEK